MNMQLNSRLCAVYPEYRLRRRDVQDRKNMVLK